MVKQDELYLTFVLPRILLGKVRRSLEYNILFTLVIDPVIRFYDKFGLRASWQIELLTFLPQTGRTNAADYLLSRNDIACASTIHVLRDSLTVALSWLTLPLSYINCLNATQPHIYLINKNYSFINLIYHDVNQN